jgi:hypothetical protein
MACIQAGSGKDRELRMADFSLIANRLSLARNNRAYRSVGPGAGLIAAPGRFLLLLFCLLLQSVSWTSAAAADMPLKIGVLAIRGKEQCLKSWSATAEYLTSSIPGRPFVIVPLNHSEINPAVEKGEVDFILTNSSSYVELEYLFGANRIATLKERRLGRVYSKYGSVIFCRADRKDIRKLTDLRGKRFMAVAETSLGGWQMTWRELHEQGIDPFREFKELVFGETHDAVVTAVLNGLSMPAQSGPTPWSSSRPRARSAWRISTLFPGCRGRIMKLRISAPPVNIRTGRWPR